MRGGWGSRSERSPYLPGRDDLVTFVREIREHPAVLVVNERSLRDEHDAISPPGAVAPLTGTVATAVGLDVWMIADLEERPDGAVGAQDDAASIAPVAPVRTAFRLVGLAMPRDRPVASGAGRDLDLRFVYERHRGQ